MQVSCKRGMASRLAEPGQPCASTCTTLDSSVQPSHVQFLELWLYNCSSSKKTARLPCQSCFLFSRAQPKLVILSAGSYNKNMTARDIIVLMQKPSDADKALIEQAFYLAEKAHAGHKRYSGEPSLNPPPAVGPKGLLNERLIGITGFL